MEYKEIEEIVLIYGKKELIEEFLEKFEIDRKHDDAPIKLRLLEGEIKQQMKKFVWKGD